MKQALHFNTAIKPIIIVGDLGLLNVIFTLYYNYFGVQTLGVPFVHSLPQVLFLLNLIYIVCCYFKGIILHERIVRPERIVACALQNVTFHALIFISLIALSDIGSISVRFFLSFYGSFLAILIAYRLTCRYLLKQYRKHGGNSRTTIFVGENQNLAELYDEISKDPTIGFRIVGYFSDQPSTLFPTHLPHLGQPSHVLPFLQHNGIEEVFCSLPSSRSAEILPIINYCENNLIRFFSVPNIRNYLHRRMHFTLLGNTPILCIRREPLTQVGNRLSKRVFDLLFSGLFLCTLFPIVFIVIGSAIKLSSPGPIFFRQKRSGENGREFWCYKFRSMRVNAECDKLQATANDPRKTRIGNFIRKTSMDELPQFVNVLLGQMSVVGPRPHMLKHTAQYSAQIDKFMVRHRVKPGITGWAQVTGFRGETKELWQMEGRVVRDVWYIEHWSFLLDMYIIYKTIKNGLCGEKEAY